MLTCTYRYIKQIVRPKIKWISSNRNPIEKKFIKPNISYIDVAKASIPFLVFKRHLIKPNKTNV